MQIKQLPAFVLAGCILGLLLTPYAYIVIGAVAKFETNVALMLVTPMLAGSGLLIWRYIIKSALAGSTQVIWIVLEVLSWLAVLFFLYTVSGFTLFTPIERIGFGSLLYLGSTLISFSVVFIRRTALSRRLSKLSMPVNIVGIAILLGGAIALSLMHLLNPAKFI